MPLGGKLAVTEVALVVTISEPGRNFPQVSPPDRLTAERTEGLRARCPVIDQNELHAATLSYTWRQVGQSSWSINLPVTGDREDRSNVDVPFTPFRARTAHVVQLGPIGIEHPLSQSAQDIQTGC